MDFNRFHGCFGFHTFSSVKVKRSLDSLFGDPRPRPLRRCLVPLVLLPSAAAAGVLCGSHLRGQRGAHRVHHRLTLSVLPGGRGAALQGRGRAAHGEVGGRQCRSLARSRAQKGPDTAARSSV